MVMAEELRRGAFHSPEQAKRELRRFAESFRNRRQWELRATRIRRGILNGAGLLPSPVKTKLAPIVHSKRTYDGYSVENVAFESQEGFFVTGNLYRPARPMPAVIPDKPRFRGRRSSS